MPLLGPEYIAWYATITREHASFADISYQCEMSESARQAIYGQYVGSADIERTFPFHPDAALPSKSGNSDHRFERVESIEVAYGPADPSQ